MKFSRLVEAELITELSKGGRWVTFKNGCHTYVSKKGRIETGPLKGGNLNNKEDMKKRFSKLGKRKKAKKAK